MIRNLMSNVARAVVRSPDRAWTVPRGQRVYAIGDIHGRLDLLSELVDAIDRDDAARGAGRTTRIFLGDFVDRGPDSRGVIEFLLRYAGNGNECVFLSGNHDDTFLRAASGDYQAASLLHRMGGRETAMSYAITPEEYAAGNFADLAALFAERVPTEHLAFLHALRMWHRVGDFVFVHAGIRPGKPMEEQGVADLHWIRGGFLDHDGCHGMIVVHGHTISDEVEICSNRIGIDTGAYRSGRLTALGLEGATRWILST